MQQLRNLMVSNVEVVRPNSNLKEAAEKMKRMDVGVLPVCEGGRVLGILTDRDIVIRAIAQGFRPEQIRVNEVMTKDVLFCFEDQTIQDAVELMRDRKIGRIVILDRDRKLRGIISLGNLSRFFGEQHFADLVAEKIEESGGLIRNRRRVLGTTLGTVAGLATLIAGVLYFRGQSTFERLEQREAA